MVVGARRVRREKLRVEWDGDDNLWERVKRTMVKSAREG